MVEIRGPIATTAVELSGVDQLTTISTGTGVAPFLQLLTKLPPNAPKIRMLHNLPPPGKTDLFADGLLPVPSVEVVRVPFGTTPSPLPANGHVMICLPAR